MDHSPFPRMRAVLSEPKPRVEQNPPPPPPPLRCGRMLKSGRRLRPRGHWDRLQTHKTQNMISVLCHQNPIQELDSLKHAPQTSLTIATKYLEAETWDKGLHLFKKIFPVTLSVTLKERKFTNWHGVCTWLVTSGPADYSPSTAWQGITPEVTAGTTSVPFIRHEMKQTPVTFL
jgi:hypothetical protein